MPAKEGMGGGRRRARGGARGSAGLGPHRESGLVVFKGCPDQRFQDVRIHVGEPADVQAAAADFVLSQAFPCGIFLCALPQYVQREVLLAGRKGDERPFVHLRTLFDWIDAEPDDARSPHHGLLTRRFLEQGEERAAVVALLRGLDGVQECRRALLRGRGLGVGHGGSVAEDEEWLVLPQNRSLYWTHEDHGLACSHGAHRLCLRAALRPREFHRVAPHRTVLRVLGCVSGRTIQSDIPPAAPTPVPRGRHRFPVSDAVQRKGRPPGNFHPERHPLGAVAGDLHVHLHPLGEGHVQMPDPADSELRLIVAQEAARRGARGLDHCEVRSSSSASSTMIPSGPRT